MQGEGLVLNIAAVGADHDVKLTGFAHVVQVLVVELEQVGVDGEIDGAALAGFQADAFKALQFLNGTGDAAHNVADVELNHLGALDSACIGDCDAGLDGAVLRH